MNAPVHGHRVNGRMSRTYQSWSAMMQRCYRPKCQSYKNYGARGITVCERWHSFACFLEDMGERPPNTTLDRLNNSANYEPSNCRWASSHEQARNRSAVRLITVDGRTQCITDWANEVGLSRYTIADRIHRAKWGVEKALTTPSRKWRKSA